MSLQASSTRVEPDIVIVHLSGNIVVWPDHDVGLTLINDLISQGERKLILDLSGVENIDSSGMQVILESYSAARHAGGELRVAGASVRVARLFQITQLNSVIPFYPTVAEACQDFPLRARAQG